MGLFDQFPYTNFHNLNLDWIIGQIKNIKTSVTSTAEDAASASESAEAAAASAGSAAESAETAGTAAALVDQVREDLDTINTEMTNFVQAHSGLYNETVLWTGTASAQGDTIELSDDIRNYKYIDVQATYKGATTSSSTLGTFPSNVVRFTPEAFTEDNAVLNIPYAYEDQLQICTVFMFWDSLDPTDYKKISLGYTRRVSINNHGDLDNAADPGTVIVKILGVKNIADAEVIDARVGADNTVYPTLKQRLDAEYSVLNSAISRGGLTEEFKQALITLVNNIGMWNDANAQTYIDALHNAMYPNANLSYITAEYTQSDTVYPDTPLAALRNDLVVTAHYDDETTEAVNSYILSGTLTAGNSTVTVSYSGKTATFTVVVSESPWDFEWHYTDGLPDNNGMTLTNSGGTISLGANGLSVSTTNSTTSSVIYKYESLSTRQTQMISELVFEITAFTELSGGGVRHYAALGGTGSAATRVGQFLVAQDGIKYLSGSSWSTLYSTALSANTEYTMRIVQTADNADVYLNGSLVGSLTQYTEVVGSPQFTVHRGASALFKSYKLKWTD